ncbi:MAG: hypothetical protein ACK4HE_03885 [Chitinophagaceae bacterium]
MSVTPPRIYCCITLVLTAAIVVVTMLYLAVQSQVADCCNPSGSVADSHAALVQTVFCMWYRL